VPVYKLIPGFLGYFATEDGDIYSAWRHGCGNKKFGDLHKKASHPNNVGNMTYRQVSLICNGKATRQYVGHLVLLAFVGPRPAGYQMCHGPNGSLDDSIENVSWGTTKKNSCDDKLRDGTLLTGEYGTNAKLKQSQIEEIYQLKGKRSQRSIADDYGVHQCEISRILSGKRWARGSLGQGGIYA
jgi:hypothetical protein